MLKKIQKYQAYLSQALFQSHNWLKKKMDGIINIITSNAADGATVSTNYEGVIYQATVTSSVAVITVPESAIVSAEDVTLNLLLDDVAGTDTETIIIDADDGVIPVVEPTFADFGTTLDGETHTFTILNGLAGYRYDLLFNGTDTTLSVLYPENEITRSGLPVDGGTYPVRISYWPDGDTSDIQFIDGTVTAYTATVTPVTSGDPMTYTELTAQKMPHMLLDADMAYMAEYARHNPMSCRLQYDSATNTISTIPDAAPSNSTLTSLPAPTGGNDTANINAAIASAPAGSTIDGGGNTYNVANVTVNKAIRLSNFDANPWGNQVTTLFAVTAADVQFYDVRMLCQNKDITFGIKAETGADRLHFVRSSYENVVFTGSSGWAQGAGIFLRGHSNVYMACPTFRNIISTASSGQNGGLRGVWIDGRGSEAVTGGIILSPIVENIQSNGVNRDGDFFVAQNIGGNAIGGIGFHILAGTGVDFGGRWAKAQTSNIHCYSTIASWTTRTADANAGGSGDRQLKAVIDCQNANDVTGMNFVFTIEQGCFSISGAYSILSNSIYPDNVRFDNNLIICNNTSRPYHQMILFVRDSSATSNTGSNATNSSMKNNVIQGSGIVSSVYRWHDGWGIGSIDTSGSSITLSYDALNTNVDP